MTIFLEPRFRDITSTVGVATGDDSAVIRYVVTTDNSEVEIDIRNFVTDTNNIPADYEGLQIGPIEIKREGDDVWSVDVTYQSPSAANTVKKLDVDEVRYSIRIGSSGSRQRYWSEQLIAEYPTNGQYQFSGTPLEKIIGLQLKKDGDTTASGVPISERMIEVSIETVRDTDTYLGTLADAVYNHSVNSAQWNIFGAQTLRLEAFDFSNRGDGSFDVSIDAIYEPALTNIDVGNGITVAEKKGQHFLDILTQEKVITSGGPGGIQVVAEVPVRAAVHRIFPEIDFATVLTL